MLKIIATVFHRFFIIIMSKLAVVFPKANSMVFVGEGSTERLCVHITSFGFKRVLLVTDKPLVELGLTDSVVKALAGQQIETVIFDGVLPDPTNQLVEEGARYLREHACEAVVAMGGGSSIDAAKIIACLATNDVPASKLVGYFKVKEIPLPLFAIPTTSGTGSEATIGAVISDTLTHEKSIMISHKMMPLCAALDPVHMTGLPPAITAATGMDALTHAVEVYICLLLNPRVEAYASQAIKLIFKYLPTAYENGADIHAREQMALAAYYAGLAINEVSVGNVHALAHQLGAHYGVPHGLANAMVLPHILTYSKDAAQDRMAQLATIIGVAEGGESPAQLAQKFIDAVRSLNEKVGIPNKLDKIREQDINDMAWGSVKEGGGYCVPILLLPEDSRRILRQLM